jgi:hypothetical protein
LPVYGGTYEQCHCPTDAAITRTTGAGGALLHQFHLCPPWPDDWAFSEKLAQANLFCLPGSVVELPGYLRFSLTASDQMIDGALSVLAKQGIGHG